MSTDDYPGEFLFLPPRKLKAGDFLLGPSHYGGLTADPAHQNDGTVLVTVQGGKQHLPTHLKIRFYRHHDPADIGTCGCDSEPGQPHDDHHCAVIDQLKLTARKIWHHRDGEVWDLPGVFQHIPRRDLEDGDVVFEPGMVGLVQTSSHHDDAPLYMLYRQDGQITPVTSDATPTRIFRPADPSHVAACMDPERDAGGYGPPCYEAHSTDHCLSLGFLREVADTLWPGLAKDRDRRGSRYIQRRGRQAAHQPFSSNTPLPRLPQRPRRRWTYRAHDVLG
ncbi:hypothetical protein DQ384_36480 [Sphaerisporangium album]|uniref:Uncharacterized protein n=1 Tax=Sphaerisporangium album TaxID=509200 RepID=A0A367EU35_9ACTN|nr:hypothetical protein [Sphaerisporangium album]RCG21115.1 hypothetical protein DQ384_36480 [Sphaerisporangium album]